MIRYIRTCLCKHEFELANQVQYKDCVVRTYLCKKCGWIRKVVT